MINLNLSLYLEYNLRMLALRKKVALTAILTFLPLLFLRSLILRNDFLIDRVTSVPQEILAFDIFLGFVVASWAVWSTVKEEKFPYLLFLLPCWIFLLYMSAIFAQGIYESLV